MLSQHSISFRRAAMTSLKARIPLQSDSSAWSLKIRVRIGPGGGTRNSWAGWGGGVRSRSSAVVSSVDRRVRFGGTRFHRRVRDAAWRQSCYVASTP